MNETVISIVIGGLGTIPKDLVRVLVESGDSIVEVSQNTKKSPVDLTRLAVSQNPVVDRLMLAWKTGRE